MPLIIGVVLAHANLYALVENWYGEAPQWPEWLIFMFANLKNILLPDRVSVLFLISGFFFFKGMQKNEPHFFGNKLKRRFHSLLIPYLAWNTLALILFYIKSNEALGCLSLQSGEEFSLLEYLSGYWAFYFTGDTPANMPLWFVRNLMVMCLLTPLLYRLLRFRYGWFFLVVMVLCLINDIVIPLPGLNLHSLLFFSLGAWLQLNNISIVNIPPLIGWISVALYVPASYFQFGLHNEQWYIACSLVVVLIKAMAMVFVYRKCFGIKLSLPFPKLQNRHSISMHCMV